MLNQLPLLCLLALTLPAGCAAESRRESDPPLRANVLLDGGQVVLPNGWKVSPAGHATKLPGDMPMRMLLANNGRELLVSIGGYNEHGISFLNAASGELLGHVKVPRTFAGMAL